ncbi:MAG: DUF86 domain-containing protein [Leptospirales bacterium]|nr:DUF86 domain-containing protein [Leptospirales bacterium]
MNDLDLLRQLLAGAGWLSTALASRLQSAVGFRNVLVHGYTEVDLAILKDVLENRSGDIAQFCVEIRQKLLD